MADQIEGGLGADTLGDDLLLSAAKGATPMCCPLGNDTIRDYERRRQIVLSEELIEAGVTEDRHPSEKKQPIDGKKAVILSYTINGNTHTTTVIGVDEAEAVTITPEFVATFEGSEEADLFEAKKNGSLLSWEILGMAGGDTLIGYKGNDTIDGGGGADTINGGAGGDSIKGNDGSDTILGNDGNDTIYGNAGNDIVDGGAGGDLLNGGQGDDQIGGREGNDVYQLSLGSDTFWGFKKGDQITYPDTWLNWNTDYANKIINRATNLGSSTSPLWGVYKNSIRLTFDVIMAGKIYEDQSVIINTNIEDDNPGWKPTPDQLGNEGPELGNLTVESNGEFSYLKYEGTVSAETITPDSLESSIQDLGVPKDSRFEVNASGGADKIEGMMESDTLNGGAGGDEIYGKGGADTINGDDGSDVIDGGAGGDSIKGNDGSDTILGNDGNDTIYGNAGNDIVDGGAGGDLLNGGQGDDQIGGREGNDVYQLSLGSDTFWGFKKGDQITYPDTWLNWNTDYANKVINRATNLGSSTSPLWGVYKNSIRLTFDVIMAGKIYEDQSVIINTNIEDDNPGWKPTPDQLGNEGPELGNLTVESNGEFSYLKYEGTVSAETITPDSLESSIQDLGVPKDSRFEVNASGGADKIEGMMESDTLNGGAGGDEIYGKGGADTINGDDGSDTIDGGAGDDTISGRLGNDDLSGAIGNDLLEGQGGDDVLRGQDGNDVLTAGSGDDSLSGGEGSDILIKNAAGKSILMGDGGNDGLMAANDGSTMLGGKGNDIILGGKGGDFIHGGAGNDQINSRYNYKKRKNCRCRSRRCRSNSILERQRRRP